MTRLLFLLGVTATTGKLLVRDKRIPRPVRWVLMLTVVCLWIPGPVDEAVILLVFGLVVVFWRQPLREAWASAHKTRTARSLARSGAPTRSDDHRPVPDRREAHQRVGGEAMMTLESRAILAWRMWGNGWSLFCRCSGCGEMRQCRGRKRSRMLCLECFDLGSEGEK